ncbi:MAG: sugar phosphate isomerase/epimerase family protein [Anaerolineae bacterium]|jgi:sugar phosphate isomerase/epimerase
MERLAIATSQPDISRHIALARRYNSGIEIQVYGYDPNLLDGGWQNLVATHKSLLRGFDGEIALHGAFYDMSSSSMDERIVALTRERYLLSLRIAAELGARNVVLHANYFPLVLRPGYLPEWTRREVTFWGEMVEEARRLGVIIALENMWEPTPDVIAGVLEQVGSPYLGACLDVGHVYLYSDTVPFHNWLDQLRGQLVHCHINNNKGLYDEHLALDAAGGVINYDEVMPMLRTLHRPPLISLEMERLEDLGRSLRYLGR